MIIYFSGTGNTRHCAEYLAQALGDTLLSLDATMLRRPAEATIDSGGEERIIWMFPTYSWGIPEKIATLMREATLTDNAHHATAWMVTTCGDDIGRTAAQWRGIMHRRGLTTAAAFSVIMPNTYTFMKGYDTDPAELEQQKLAASSATLDNIARAIAAGNATADVVTEGRFPWIKTAIVRPYFNRFCTSPKPFHSSDACTRCGLCARTCPMDNIAMTGADGKPAWDNECMLCTRCYHICPTHAVEYGRQTAGKGQYRHFLRHLRDKK